MATPQAKQALREQRKQQGLCIHCGAPAKPDQTRCQGCADKDKANRKRYTERDKALGICPNLGCHNQVTPGKVYCEPCKQEKEAQRQRRQDRRRKADKCRDCELPAVPGKARCQTHLDRVNASTTDLAKRRTAAGLCTRCGNVPFLEGQKQCDACSAEGRERHRQLKLKVLDAYGGPVCVGCGETEVAVLQIDHIAGGGHKHAKLIGAGNATVGRSKMYKWLKDNNYPPGFRVLCPNCNVRASRKLPFPNPVPVNTILVGVP
jgi:ribosomal protein L37E